MTIEHTGKTHDPAPERPDPYRKAAARALDQQLAALRTRLLRHARFALHDDGLAEDLVQETLIAVLEQVGDHRGDASLSTWATAILKNKVADWYRSPARRRMLSVDMTPDGLAEQLDALYNQEGAYAQTVPGWQQPEGRAEQRQMMSVLERCLSHMPRQAGRVFMMREWLGFDTGEICERLGVTAENCRTILHRARMALRACMQRDWIEARTAA